MLIALPDPNHAHNHAARTWLAARPRLGLATCALTENGFLRIYARPSYSNRPGSPGKALLDLKAYRARRGHCFLPSDLSFDAPCLTDVKSLTPKQLTDVYLAGLALKHGTRLATFDGSIPVEVLTGGGQAIEQIPV